MDFYGPRRHKLKQALLSTPILRLPDFSKTFVVECDASSDGVGAILSQDDHLVAYFSKGFSPSNRFKSDYDRELLALVLAVTEIKSGLQIDPYTSDIIQKLLSPDSSSVSDFSFVDQFLFYKRRLVIPNISNLKVRLLQEAHDTPSGGHGGFLKTFKRLSDQFYWPRMKQEVRLFVQQCLVCQQQKYQTLSPAGLLQPLPVPTRIWEDISMDFIVGLPPSGRFDTILVVVDRLSKYAHFICLSHPFTAKVVASAFCKEVVRLHGFPRSIVSDRDVGTPSLLPYVMGETKNAELEQQLADRIGTITLAPSRLLQLDLPPESRIHPIFHVLMLKPANGLISTDMAPLPITKDWEIDIQPHSVLAHRWVNEAGKQVLELLISWCDRPQEEATWEAYDLLADQFSNFRLEDKTFYQEGSNDTIPVKVYTRKKNRVKGQSQFNLIFGYWLDPLGQSSRKMEWWGAAYKPIFRAIN
ncbi:retrotransposable element Tf2 [Tanacetum coccineum]